MHIVGASATCSAGAFPSTVSRVRFRSQRFLSWAWFFIWSSYDAARLRALRKCSSKQPCYFSSWGFPFMWYKALPLPFSARHPSNPIVSSVYLAIVCVSAPLGAQFWSVSALTVSDCIRVCLAPPLRAPLARPSGRPSSLNSWCCVQLVGASAKCIARAVPVPSPVSQERFCSEDLLSRRWRVIWSVYDAGRLRSLHNL